jgi:hypothetical protein
MYAMSTALGYSFDKVQLKRGAYYPVAHSEADLAQLSIRGLRGLHLFQTGHSHNGRGDGCGFCG